DRGKSCGVPDRFPGAGLPRFVHSDKIHVGTNLSLGPHAARSNVGVWSFAIYDCSAILILRLPTKGMKSVGSPPWCSIRASSRASSRAVSALEVGTLHWPQARMGPRGPADPVFRVQAFTSPPTYLVLE